MIDVLVILLVASVSVAGLIVAYHNFTKDPPVTDDEGEEE